MRPSPLRVVILVVANLLGVAAFVWPFLLPAAVGAETAHAIDAPWIFIALLACLGILLFVELGRGGLGPKTVALLGVLGAAMVALRLPGFVAGFSAMFIVVLVAGNAFGPGFGFLLGAMGTMASGLFVGGLGPWLPFQMVAVGWIGLGAGLLPRRGRGTDTGSRRVRVRRRLPLRRRDESVVLAVRRRFVRAGMGRRGRGAGEPQAIRHLLHGDLGLVGLRSSRGQRRHGGRAGPAAAGRTRSRRSPDAPRRGARGGRRAGVTCGARAPTGTQRERIIRTGAGRVAAARSSTPGRGKSGLHRAGRWGMSQAGRPVESATESRPPGLGRVRVKR